MAITRKFIDWKSDSIESLSQYLQQRYCSPSSSGPPKPASDLLPQELDLSHCVIVLPGRRAGRRLLHHLAFATKTASCVLTPPKMCTPGQLPEVLYKPRRPFATEIVQRLTWVAALRNLRRGAANVLKEIPADDDLDSWLDYCDLFRETHIELAGEGFDFREIILKGQKIPGFSDADKWRFLRRLQQKYLDLLDAQGLWDQQTARLVAIEKHECQTDLDIVLAGTVDLNRSTQMMLDQVAEKVTALVFAPESLADRFDHYGCLNPGHWEEAKIKVDDRQLVIADGSEDIAAAAIECLASWQEKYQAEEVNVAVADRSLVPELQQQMQLAGISNDWAGGVPVRQSMPFQLVNSIAAYIGIGRFSDFASLIRHPQIHRWLLNQPLGNQPESDDHSSVDLLTELDNYFNEHLQPKLGFWLGGREKSRNIRQAFDQIQELLAPLNKPRYRRLCHWAPLINQVLSEIYFGVEFDTSRETENASVESLKKIQSKLAELVAIGESVAPNVTAVTAFEILIKLLESESINMLLEDNEIEMLGWLDLALDNARATVVTSFNEGFLPQSINADMLLPNSLRKRLHLTDNSRRYARDAYLLNWLVENRQELILVVGRRSVDGDPLLPSRLLFATDRNKIAPRVADLFGTGWNIKLNAAKQTVDGPLQSVTVRKPRPLETPVQSMSVTAFRNYIACPYYFYLKHVLRLEPLDDAVSELSPPAFGNAIHDVLENFGRSDLRESRDSDEIRNYLRDLLDKYFIRVFGKSTLPAVDVQKRQTRIRLDTFANWQAAWASDGWKITHTEIAAENTFIDIDGSRQMQLRGRIDRIDHHAETNQWAILDYKTGDNFKTPEKAHRQAGQWTDLQLPLYRLICRTMGLDGTYRLGYVTLPKDLSQIKEHFASWSDQELDEAELMAKDIAAKVMDEKFWPMTQPAHLYRRDFAVICQDNVFEPSIEGIEVGA